MNPWVLWIVGGVILGYADIPSAPAGLTVSPCLPADFYVDPDYLGATKDGSAARPWSRLDSSEWAVIDASLAQCDVTVHYSSREAGSDTDEISLFPVKVLRTDSSSHRVMLDGMSKYNANDMTPSWSNYSGASKLKVEFNTGPVVTTENHVRNYVTIRGFKSVPIANRSGAWIWGGSHFLLEACEGIEVTYNYCWRSDGTGSGIPCTDIVIRNNQIDRCNGECVYIGGSDETYDPSVVAHTGILIEGNTISRANYFNTVGGEGDGIDVKRGNRDVVIRANRITHGRVGTAAGIVATCPVKVENNVITDFENGIRVTAQVSPEMVVIQHNIVYDNLQRGIWCGGVGGILRHNTIAGNAEGIYIATESKVEVKENILFQNTKQVSAYGSGKTFDYNLYFPNVFSGQDIHFLALDPQFVDYLSHDFALRPTSPVCNGGEGATYFGALPCNN